jgi:hypothetical protein
MFTFIFAIIFLASFFAPETLVTTIIGGVIALVGTQWIKNATGLFGVGATVLAFFVSLVVAVAALSISMLLSGEFSWSAVAANSAQIFTLATLAYRLFVPTAPTE